MLEHNAMVERILDAVCDEYSVDREQLSASYKRAPVKYAIAKQVACYFLRDVGNVSKREMKKLVGYNTRGIITYNIKLTIKIMSVDKTLREQINRIATRINE